MNYNSIIIKLYFLLVYADGNANEKEVAIAKQMIKAENINEDEFNVQLQLMKAMDLTSLYSEALLALRKLNHKQQVRMVAWLCVIANADGFMDHGEWQLIYKIYHKELDLPLNEIFDVQKELNRMVWEKNLIHTIS